LVGSTNIPTGPLKYFSLSPKNIRVAFEGLSKGPIFLY
jgi:hypothetical protein